MTTNKDDFDTTYRKVHGIYIVGYDADTDTYNKLHVDQNGHIYTKLLGSYNSAAIEIEADSTGKLKTTLAGETVAFTGEEKTVVVYVSGSVFYVCKATIGTALATAAWQIKKVDTTTGVIIQWCDGNANYDNTATNLSVVSGKTYSY